MNESLSALVLIYTFPDGMNQASLPLPFLLPTPHHTITSYPRLRLVIQLAFLHHTYLIYLLGTTMTIPAEPPQDTI